jgi:hypothetical protein
MILSLRLRGPLPQPDVLLQGWNLFSQQKRPKTQLSNFLLFISLQCFEM